MAAQRLLALLSLLLAAGGLALQATRAPPLFSQEAKVLPTDGAAGDLFGGHVAISGDYALVSAKNDGDNGDKSGSAYVYVRAGAEWTEQAKLMPADGAYGDEFGASVALSGRYALVGASRDSDDGYKRGSAYIFVREGAVWAQQAKLLASDGETFDSFGVSVALSGDDDAIVGAWGDDLSGSAYIFVRSGAEWTEQAKLLPTDGAAGDLFGGSVALSGDYALVGAENDEDNGYKSGSAHVFVRSGAEWRHQAKLRASDGGAYDLFGTSVAIAGDYALIGAGANDERRSGSAYIFVRSGAEDARGSR